MLQPSFTVTAEVDRDDYSKFIIEPLEKGFGHTLGVSLRRVLLSSMEGAAITNVRIDSVTHQFSTLKGMKEDVVDLILNLKQLKFRVNSDEPATIRLSVKGPGTVTGKDLDLPAGVTVANPDVVLAQLSDAKTKLNCELTVSQGMGYSPAADRPAGSLGDIPVDAAFSPIIKVAYNVVSTRVGRRTDFDKLILEVWSDGTIKPREVVDDAAKILVGYFKQVFEPTNLPAATTEELTVPLEGEVYKLTVEELDLPTRIANALRKGGYKTVKDLVGANHNDVAKVKNLGEKSVDVVAKALAQKGLTLKDYQLSE